MEELDIKITIVIVVAILIGVAPWYGFYKLGRFLERRDLTQHFIKNIQQVYSDGHYDAALDCKNGRLQ